MTILAVDTTSEFGSLAIRSQQRTLAEIALHSPEGFGHVLFQAIEDILREAALRLEEIDCFAAASGPGSFTGVRIGLAAVKGLAAATGKAAAGVSILQALASVGDLPLRATVLDARRGEVYAAVYDSDLRPVEPETVAPLAAWLGTLSAPLYQFISPAALALQATRFRDMPFVQAPKQLAAAVALCAEREPLQDPAELDANYVRRSDAELFWKES